MEKTYYTVQEVAQELDIADVTVRSAINEGRLPFTIMYGRKLVSYLDLEAYRRRTRPSGQKPKGRPKKQKEADMKRKLGRNDACWCHATYPDGKLKKFKDCHLDRDKQAALNMGDVIRGVKSVFGKHYCLHADAGPNCSGNIIKAHTIQRNGGLSRIAQNGHVYTFDPGTSSLIKTGQLAVRRIGIAQASAFTGFCGKHDGTAFEPVEQHPFRNTDEQIFLLAYRALCREVFYKRGRLEHIAHLRDIDKGASSAHQRLIQSEIALMEMAVRAGLDDMEHIKAEYDAALLRGDYGAIRYYMIKTDQIPDFVSSGMFQPEFDFQGNRLQNLAELDRVLDHITLNVIPTDTGGVVMLSWMGELSACKRLVQSLDLLPDDAVPDAVLRLAVEHLENTFLAPEWWDYLPQNIQDSLIKRAHSGMDPSEEWRKATALMDDSIRVARWKMNLRLSNTL